MQNTEETQNNNVTPTIAHPGVCYIHEETGARLDVSKYGNYLIHGVDGELIPIFTDDELVHYLTLDDIPLNEGWRLGVVHCRCCLSRQLDPCDTICLSCKLKMHLGINDDEQEHPSKAASIAVGFITALVFNPKKALRTARKALVG